MLGLANKGRSQQHTIDLQKNLGNFLISSNFLQSSQEQEKVYSQPHKFKIRAAIVWLLIMKRKTIRRKIL